MKFPINLQEAAPLLALQLLAQAVLLTAGLNLGEAVGVVTVLSVLAPVVSAKARFAYKLAFNPR